MTTDQKNRRLAELLGWTGIGGRYTSEPAEAAPWIFEDQWGVCPEGEFTTIPDYCGDLNAVHAAENAVLKGAKKRMAYDGHLVGLMDWRQKAGIGRYTWHATAEQRVDALILTLEGK